MYKRHSLQFAVTNRRAGWRWEGCNFVVIFHVYLLQPIFPPNFPIVQLEWSAGSAAPVDVPLYAAASSSNIATERNGVVIYESCVEETWVCPLSTVFGLKLQQVTSVHMKELVWQAPGLPFYRAGHLLLLQCNPLLATIVSILATFEGSKVSSVALVDARCRSP